jgi:restriction system protein
MDIPANSQLLWPVVCALRDLGGSGSIYEIDAKVAEQQRFSEDLQSALHGDGPMTEVGYRLHWARTYLKGMGLATNISRGVWALTETGRTASARDLPPLENAYRARKRAERKSRELEEEEVIGEVSWQEELLEALLALTPEAFERLCRRLLREAGFSRTEVTGRSGDGGIDGLGVYRLSLVSFPVFFQAKRWRNSVGSKEVRDFRGAMQGRGEKGLLITTSTFTSEAKLEASRDGAPPVDLVDGALLCDLLVQHRIGVRVVERTVLDVSLDAEALSAI